jgi:hypothetical protein
MPQRPNDRPAAGGTPISDDDPRLIVIVGSDKFPRPGLETFFAESSKRTERETEVEIETWCSCDAVIRTYCACNKVCRCVGKCTCVGHVSCSCHSHSSRSGGCRCAPVH